MNGKIFLLAIAVVHSGSGAASAREADFTAADAPILSGRGDRPGMLRSIRARFEVALTTACAERANPNDVCELTALDRDELMGLARYTASLRVGPGPGDHVVVTRLVREDVPGVTPRTILPIFLVHGSTLGFMDNFARKTRSPEEPGAAAWLARRGVDVWAVDLRFTLVPASTTDFAFMSGWDFQTDVSDVMLATRFARHARRVTGQGYGRLHLLGHSNGASIAYAVVNAEAALPEDERDVGTLVPIDTTYKLLPEHNTQRAFACSLAAAQRAALANGVYQQGNATTITAGRLARTDPSGSSPFRAGWTNAEWALQQGCATTLAPAFPFHRIACTFGESGRPVGARFSSAAATFELLENSVPFRNRSGARDYWEIPCDEKDVPFDDHLAEVTLPVLYVGMAGGFGEAGTDTQSFLGGDDVTSWIVQLLPDGAGAQDFGHVDVWLADEAESLVWAPILQWVLDRRSYAE